MSPTNQKIARLIRRIWERRRTSDPRTWSLRSVAREGNWSPGYLSKLLQGKKPISRVTALKLCGLLKADKLTQKNIIECFEHPAQRSQRPKKKTAGLSSYELPRESSEWLLVKWYRLPLLDLMTTANFESDVRWIAKRLGLPVKEVASSLDLLVAEGLAEKDADGRYRKIHERIRFPSSISKRSIRSYHQAQLQRASAELDRKVTPKDSTTG